MLLEQVLVNVLDNATRYAPAGAQLALRASASGDTVSLVIADEGVGIARTGTGLPGTKIAIRLRRAP